MYIEKIKSPADLKKLDLKELQVWLMKPDRLC